MHPHIPLGSNGFREGHWRGSCVKAGVRRLLFLPRGEADIERLSATLEDEAYEVTSTCAHGAMERLSASRYDAVVISESLYRGRDRSHTAEVVEFARNLEVPVLVFPARPAPPRGRLKRLISLPTSRRRGPGGNPAGRAHLEQLFDDAIRPSFQARGGDIEIVEVLGEQVIVRFLGVCAACPSSRNRHREEIEKFLRSEVPGVKFVVVEQNGFPPGRWW